MRSVAKYQKNEGGTLWRQSFEEKSHTAEKNERGAFPTFRSRPVLYVSPVFCMYLKKEQVLWFSSLG